MQNITPEAVYSQLYRTLCKTKRLSYVDWKALTDWTAITSFKANEIIVEAGSLSTHSYFIISGLIMCYEGHDPKHAKWFRAEGSYAFIADKFKYGEVGRVNKRTMMALEDSLVVSIGHADLLWLCDHHPKISMLETGIIFRLSYLMNEITDCMIVDAREKYTWLEEQLGFSLERIPDAYLLPYLRTTLKRLKEIRKTKPVSFLTRY